MADLNPKNAAKANTSAGHLSVHVEGAHPPEVKFSFEREPKRLTFSIVGSIVLDILIAALFVLASRYKPAVAAVALLPDLANKDIVWLSEPGPGGGGGGGGNKMKEPPRKAELPGKDKITVPVQKPPKLEPPQQAKNEPNPIEQLNIPAKELAAAQDSLPGAIEAPPGPPTVSQGSGSGGGAGTGTGSGIGPGTRFGSRTWKRRRNRRRNLSAGQWRDDPGRRPRGEAGVHLGRDARQSAGLCPPGVHRPA